MQLPEAADLLHVTEATLRRWMRQGLMPVHAVGGAPFDRQELEEWARDRGLPFGDTGARTPEKTERLLSSAIARGAVVHGANPASASDAIETALRAVTDLEPAVRADVLQRVLARERLASTALGHGVALPHPRDPLEGILADPVVVVVHLGQVLDWAALDAEPVHTVLLLLSPSAPVHLQLLSRVSIVLHTPGVTDALRDGPRGAELVERIRRIEGQLAQ